MSISDLSVVGGVLMLLTFAHFAADWVFQTHNEAMRKTRHHGVRAVHCLIYASLITVAVVAILRPVPDWPVMAAVFATLWLSHFVEDSYVPVYIWAKYVRRVPELWDYPAQGGNVVELQPRSEMDRFKQFADTVLGKILLIAIDQIVHIAFLVPVASMLVFPESVWWAFGTALVSVGILAVGSFFAMKRLKEDSWHTKSKRPSVKPKTAARA